MGRLALSSTIVAVVLAPVDAEVATTTAVPCPAYRDRAAAAGVSLGLAGSPP